MENKKSHIDPSIINGTVKFYNTDKGYGFIIPEHGGRDVFIHITRLRVSGWNELKTGDKIAFQQIQDAQGRLSVTKVIEITEAPQQPTQQATVQPRTPNYT